MIDKPETVRVLFDREASREADETIFAVRDMSQTPVTFGTPRQVHDWLTGNGYEWATASRGLWWRKTAERLTA